jgi:hypothetical protein
MEGFEKNNESAESISDWKELKEHAHEQADGHISRIDGYTEMEPEEKISALDVLLTELSEKNVNRYIAREVSLRREQIKELSRHSARMAELGVTV